MVKRYTIKELDEMTDYEMLSWIVRDRQEATTNMFSPLNKRLDTLKGKIGRKEELTK